MDSSLVVMEDSDAPEEDERSPSIVYIIPTSHVSESSSQEVSEKIDALQPDTVAVELDESRFQRLVNRNTEEKMSVRDILSADQIPFRGKVILSMMTVLQRNISERLGIDMSGIDMLAGIESADKYDIPVALVDQDMKVTINRFSEEVSLKELFKMVGYSGLAYLQFWKSSDKNLEEQVDHNNMDVDNIINQMGSSFPSFKKVFLDERNDVIAENVIELSNEFEEIALIIGAAHEPGVRDILEESSLVTIEEISLLNQSQDTASDSEPLSE